MAVAAAVIEKCVIARQLFGPDLGELVMRTAGLRVAVLDEDGVEMLLYDLIENPNGRVYVDVEGRRRSSCYNTMVFGGTALKFAGGYTAERTGKKYDMWLFVLPHEYTIRTNVRSLGHVVFMEFSSIARALAPKEWLTVNSVMSMHDLASAAAYTRGCPLCRASVHLEMDGDEITVNEI